MKNPFPRISLLSLLIVVFVSVHAQFEVYSTVDDLLNNTPQIYPNFDFKKQDGLKKNSKIILRNDATKDEVEIDCAGIWGFSYRGGLYRIVKEGKYYTGAKAPYNMPVQLLMKKDGAFLWLNAIGMLDYAKKSARRKAEGKDVYPFYFEYQSYQAYLSPSVDGDMMVILGGKYAGTPKWVGIGEEEFMRDNSDLQWLRDCAMGKKWKFWGNHYTYNVVKECFEEHGSSTE